VIYEQEHPGLVTPTVDSAPADQELDFDRGSNCREQGRRQ